MSQRIICDICQKPIDVSGHGIKIDAEPPMDLCHECFISPVILSEKRRTRTRKVVKKPGRPKGKTNTSPHQEASVNSHLDMAEVSDRLKAIAKKREHGAPNL
jgi:ribosome-binding protein aMBF1 (putative translation factor)